MDSLLKQTIPKFHPGTKMFIPCSCYSPMGGDWWLSWEGRIVLYSHPVIQDPSVLFTYLSLFPLSPHYLTIQYRKRILMATWVFVWGSLEVMLLGTSHHFPGLSHMLCAATREFRKSKISVIENPLSYCSKLVFEVYHFMGNRWGNRVILYFWGRKITADGDCSHEIKQHLLLGRKVMINLHSIFKSRNITLPTKVHLVKAMVLPVAMYGCESWMVKKAESQRIDVFELWCWRRLLRVPWL